MASKRSRNTRKTEPQSFVLAGDDHGKPIKFDAGSIMPESSGGKISQARKWARENPWVRMVLGLKLAFYNYGLKVTGKRPLPTQADGFVTQTWRQWLRFENVVGFWRPRQMPFHLRLERCEYKDDFGVKVLKYRHGLTTADIERKDADGKYLFSEKEREELKKKPVIIYTDGDPFEVLTRDEEGSGFSDPTLVSIFKECTQFESMTVGECAVAHHCRTAIRHAKAGHETRYGLNAGSNKNFAKEDRLNVIKKHLATLTGPADIFTNFDVSIEYPYPNMASFDAKKWDGVRKRLQMWAGPIGWMLEAKGITPNLMEMFRTEAEAERVWLKPFVEHCLSEALNTTVTVKWSSKCFKDNRLFADMLKFLVQQGPGSLTTAVEEAGLDPEIERSNKQKEAKAPKEFTPLFDAAHGNNPGKPRGTKDSDEGQG